MTFRFFIVTDSYSIYGTNDEELVKNLREGMIIIDHKENKELGDVPRNDIPIADYATLEGGE